MTSITGLKCATGEGWYSWPVGTPASALEEVDTRFADKPDAISNVDLAITSFDAHLNELGASVGGVWAPDSLDGLVAATWWAGVMPPSDDSILRNGLRYRRSIEGRAFDRDETVYWSSVDTLVVNDIEAVAMYESRSEEGAEPYILARVVYFPIWTKERVVLEATCPVLTVAEDFASQIAATAGQLTLLSTTSD